MTAANSSLFTRARNQKKLEDGWDNSEHTEMLPFTNGELDTDFTEAYDQFIEDLHCVRGSEGVPLDYLARKQLIPSDDADDPPANYTTPDDEMVARARIIMEDLEMGDSTDYHPYDGYPSMWTEMAKVDNLLLYDLCKKKFGKTQAWSHVQMHKKTRDGRATLKTMWHCYNGANALDQRYDKVKLKLQKLEYHREGKQFPWSKYVVGHKDCHAVIARLVDHGHLGITERDKVTALINGIKTQDLAVPLGIINADQNGMRGGDFEKAQMHIAEHIRTSKARTSTAAEMTTKQGGRGGRGGSQGGKGKGRGGGGGHKDVLSDEEAIKRCKHITKYYYPTEQYKKLNAFEKRKVYLNQQEQAKRKEGVPDTHDGKQLSAAISELNTNVIASMEMVKQTDKAVKQLKRKSGSYSSDDNKSLFSDKLETIDVPLSLLSPRHS